MPDVIKESNKKVVYETLNEDKTIVQQMEEEWPQMTAEFRRLQREQYELFLHKQHDYGPGNISVGTQLQTEDEIHLSLTGLWFRMNDKIQRLKNLLMNIFQGGHLILALDVTHMSNGILLSNKPINLGHNI